MKNKWNGLYLVVITVMVAFAAQAHAQFAYTQSGPVTHEFNYKIAAGDPQVNTFYFDTGVDITPTKGAPYTAKAVTTTVQTLADGNKITHTNEVTLARDSEGRTRREQSLANLGPWETNAKGSVVVINDPVSHVRYELQRIGDKTTASKTQSLERTRVLDGRAAKELAEVQAQAMTQMREGRGAGVGAGVGVGVEPGVGSNIVIVTSGGENVIRRKVGSDAEENKNVKVEDLGTHTIEGVTATGTRKTVTIPAGQIGNEQPIYIVSETWYSADLKTTVMSKRNDPRVGETDFKLTEIQRNEPDASLFQLPAGVEINTPKIVRDREF